MSYVGIESRDGIRLQKSPDQPLPLFTAQRLALLPTARLHRVGIDLSYGISEHKRILAALCKNPLREKALLTEINDQTHQETRRIIEEGNISCDCLIVGTGPAGVSAAIKIRQLLPHARLLMVDERNYRGGQFADEGYDYLLNTPRTGKRVGFPGELEPTNNIGDGAFLQLTDITDEQEYAHRKKLATCLQIDSFIASPALVGVRVDSTEITGNTEIPYIVHATDRNTNTQIEIRPKVVVLARGLGKPTYGVDTSIPDTKEALAQREKNIFVSEAFNSYIDTISPQELFSTIKNGLVFIGGGDSTSTALDGILKKLLTTFSPEEIHKLRIDIYGAKYTGPSDFESVVRIPRYNGLMPYIGTLIQPHKEKVHHLLTAGNNTVGIATDTSLTMYQTVAIMTGYKNKPIEQTVTYSDGSAVHVVDVFGDEELKNELIARQIEGENIFSMGIEVKEDFIGRPPVFSRSIVRLTPKILATAEKVAAILQASDDALNI